MTSRIAVFRAAAIAVAAIQLALAARSGAEEFWLISFLAWGGARLVARAGGDETPAFAVRIAGGVLLASSLFELAIAQQYQMGHRLAPLAGGLGLVWNDPILLTRLIALGGMGTAFVLLFYLHSERSMDLVYGVLYACFSAVALFWILPYAAFTARSRSWLTR